MLQLLLLLRLVSRSTNSLRNLVPNADSLIVLYTSSGHCNTLGTSCLTSCYEDDGNHIANISSSRLAGTASTMNALAEALGMALPGSSAIPAPYRERGQCAYVSLH